MATRESIEGFSLSGGTLELTSSVVREIGRGTFIQSLFWVLVRARRFAIIEEVFMGGMGRSVQWAILEDSLRSENRGVLPQESCQLTFTVRLAASEHLNSYD